MGSLCRPGSQARIKRTQSLSRSMRCASAKATASYSSSGETASRANGKSSLVSNPATGRWCSPACAPANVSLPKDGSGSPTAGGRGIAAARLPGARAAMSSAAAADAPQAKSPEVLRASPLAKFFFLKTTFGILLSIVFVVGGLFAYNQLVKEALPDLDIPQATVTTAWPGADPLT